MSQIFILNIKCKFNSFDIFSKKTIIQKKLSQHMLFMDKRRQGIEPNPHCSLIFKVTFHDLAISSKQLNFELSFFYIHLYIGKEHKAMEYQPILPKTSMYWYLTFIFKVTLFEFHCFAQTPKRFNIETIMLPSVNDSQNISVQYLICQSAPHQHMIH